MFVDSHSHIYDDKFDIHTEIKECLDADVTRIYMPNIDMESIPMMKKVAEQYPDTCIPMMGLHPCYVKEDYKKQLDIITKELQTGNYAAVGEIGMDLYWDKTFVEEQKEVFAYQTSLAKELGLAINIHARNAIDECLKIVKEQQNGELKGVFHCFTGNLRQAKEIMDVGFLMGIGGVVTFKNAGLIKVVAEIPVESMVLETDAPYLAPHPYRGKQNSSRYIPLIAEKIASIKEMRVEVVADITSKNCDVIFR